MNNNHSARRLNVHWAYNCWWTPMLDVVALSLLRRYQEPYE